MRTWSLRGAPSCRASAWRGRPSSPSAGGRRNRSWILSHTLLDQEVTLAGSPPAGRSQCINMQVCFQRLPNFSNTQLRYRTLHGHVRGAPRSLREHAAPIQRAAERVCGALQQAAKAGTEVEMWRLYGGRSPHGPTCVCTNGPLELADQWHVHLRRGNDNGGGGRSCFRASPMRFGSLSPARVD